MSHMSIYFKVTSQATSFTENMFTSYLDTCTFVTTWEAMSNSETPGCSTFHVTPRGKFCALSPVRVFSPALGSVSTWRGCIALWFWGSGLGPTGLKCRCCQGCVSGGSRGESVSCLFRILEAAHTLGCGPFLLLQRQQHDIFKSLSLLLPSFT